VDSCNFFIFAPYLQQNEEKLSKMKNLSLMETLELNALALLAMAAVEDDRIGCRVNHEYMFEK
jgi:hypothetical protein